MANIVYDDVSSLISTGGGSWKTVTESRYFGGSTIYPPFSSNDDGDTGVYATLTVTFQGTSIAFIGNTPYIKCSQYADVSIDGGTAVQSSYSDPSPQNTIQWYQSPTLSDGSHTISVTQIAGTALDFIVVTAGLTTPLSGQTLIVDDSDSSISYSGSWTNPTGRYVTGNSSVEFYPYENAVHQSGTVGSSMTFQFTGTAVSVYSVFDYSTIGNMVVVYSVDSTSQTQSYTVSTDTPEYKDGVGHRGNVLLYSSSALSAGTHTLTIQITSNNAMALTLDYILYTPSFDTLAAKLGINSATLTTSTTTASSSPTTSSVGASGSDSSPPIATSGSHSGSQTITQSSNVSSYFTSSPSGSSHLSPSSSTTMISSNGVTSSNEGADTNSSSPASKTSSTLIGAIVGSVLGALIVILLLLFFFICRRRRRRSLFDRTAISQPFTIQNDNQSQLSQPEDNLIVKPFIGTVPSSSYHDDVKKPNGSSSVTPPPTSSSYPFSQSTRSPAPESDAGNDFIETTATSISRTNHVASESKAHLLSSPTRNIESPPSVMHGTHDADIPYPLSPNRRTDTGTLRSRMQRLQDLVQELNRALSGGQPDSVYIADLRGRIKNLTREDGEAIELDWRGSVTPSGVPPPYQC